MRDVKSEPNDVHSGERRQLRAPRQPAALSEPSAEARQRRASAAQQRSAGPRMSQSCVAPNEVSDRDLLVPDAERSPTVAEHLARCAACRADAAAYRRAERRLTALLYRVDCPSAQTLGEYYLGLVRRSQRDRIAAHLEWCVHCAAELEQFRAAFADEPAAADQLRLGTVIAGGLRRLIATLTPATPGLGYAVRGEGVGAGGPQRDQGRAGVPAARTFSAAGIEITLQVEPGRGPGDPRTLLGLMVRTDGSNEPLGGARIALRPRRGPERVTTLDEAGNFVFEDLPPGSYGLEVQLPDLMILVPAFEV